MNETTRAAARWAMLAGALGAGLVAGAANAAAPSGVTGFDVATSDPVGTFDGVPYVRIRGVAHGRVAPNETVAGLAALPKDADGDYDYAAEFEVIQPAKGQPADDVVFVEAENRGNPVFLTALDHFLAGGKPSTANYPAGLGNGFLPGHHIAYARVQWQTGIAAGVPATAQGVGEVIVRDFARALAGQAPAADAGLGAYKVRLLGAISQSAWFVNAFIAEGFNEDPITHGPVFGGAIAIDGTGNWIAINQMADKAGFPEYPYPNEASHPMTDWGLMTRPKSDPVYIDVANFTDFYRLRASVSESAPLPANVHRYDWPTPHAAGSAGAAARLAACNNGQPAQLDPISYAPYARALVAKLAQLNPAVLPSSAMFLLGPAPDDPAHFNALPGVTVKVPRRDAAGQPVGGVRFPEDEAPVGKITVSLPHVGLDSISDACGNLAEWQPMTAAELTAKYGSKDAYLKRYEAALDKLIAEGYVLAPDKPAMMTTAAALWDNPAGY